ncbi:MAG: TonB-dependent receptor [Bryobacteraceae bacterium]
MRSLVLFALPLLALAQETGSIKGTVTLADTGEPLHRATVSINRTSRVAETGEDGAYEIADLAPGEYTLLVHLQSLSDTTQSVVVTARQAVVVDFALKLAPMRVAMTVTASDQEQSTFEAFQSVATVESIELALKAKPSLGEVLDNQPGVSKRSFGPGSSRPVIRGFDGDRVLVMQDGMPSGALSSQSGDHGESLDAASLDRVEVVKGPATLLYGSNAIGGVVNAVTGHHMAHDHPHQGTRGYLTGFGGSANGYAGGAAGFDVGIGNWMLWGSGSGQRTGDYQTPLGRIDNSATRLSNSSGGLAWYGAKKYFDAGYRYEEGRYGVPFAGAFEGESDAKIDLSFRRHNLRFGTGWKNLDFALPSFRFSVNYSDWEHRELEDEQVGTVFHNKILTWRGVFQQKKYGRLTGSFGFQGSLRDYLSTGAEALSPPVDQHNVAAFGLEELEFEHFRLQLGARVDHTGYSPTGLVARSFNGFSGAAGIYVPTWRNGAFVANFTSSFRAPALEELYNNGPHVGTLTYEVGNSLLTRERSNGLDLALRHAGHKLRGEISYFYYDMADFVYLAPTGRMLDGLIEADYGQAASRFTGGEMGLDFALHDSFWLNLGLDYVNAQLKSGVPLPRIPPLRGRVGFDIRRGGFSFKPELRLANQQARVFPTETRTAGYSVFGVTASYTIARQHAAHVFGVDAFNLGDRLYRNHLSFIKNLAPEIGRGIRFTYTVRFF